MPPKPKLIPVTPEERVGYEIPGPTGRHSGGTVPIGSSDITVIREPWWHTIRTQERVGLIVFAAGLYWIFKTAAFVGTWANLQQLLISSRPTQFAALGILIWLHAKWRRLTRVV